MKTAGSVGPSGAAAGVRKDRPERLFSSQLLKRQGWDQMPSVENNHCNIIHLLRVGACWL
jgi:hypothetical protein